MKRRREEAMQNRMKLNFRFFVITFAVLTLFAVNFPAHAAVLLNENFDASC